MSQSEPTPAYQRNALIPGFIALATLIVGVAFVGSEWFSVVRYIVSIVALIVLWFAFRARHWWWVPVFLAIAVLWNPVYPFGFSGIFWLLAQPIVGSLFLIAGALIAQPRVQAQTISRTDIQRNRRN